MAAVCSLALSAPASLSASPSPSLAPCTSHRIAQAPLRLRCAAQGCSGDNAESADVSRRGALLSALSLSVCQTLPAVAAPPQSLPKTDDNDVKLCDAECEKGIEQYPLVTTPSGLQYRDILIGRGPSPPVGFQVAADYVAMVPSGRVFDSSIEKKVPYIFRVGSGQVVAGLDEGILTMAVGGLRRLYVPGDLSFPKGLPSAPGRPRVPPSSPVVFDVKLLYIPGLEDDDE